jgi:hypothetical protein
MAKSVYLTAIIATIAILVIVFFSIKGAEDAKFSELNKELDQIVMENTLFSFYADFDQDNKESYCAVLDQSISNLSKRVSSLEKRLAAYEESSFNTEEFYLTKRNYLMTNMFLYKSHQDAMAKCDWNTKLVLFFYAEDKSCDPNCGIIGTQLVDLKRDCNTFRNFNFPYSWPVYDFTKILEAKYNVTKPGTLIIDGEKTESLLTMSELSKKLGCSN